ncbi:MAG: VWA domain-containing protein, partial [Myxococcales bacterium]|nr:VWA domain-containing protein [Myxococcales bacterium]
MGLASPLALLALLAVAAPIVAHLMRRHDLRAVTLPTLRLLAAAQARSRRRLELIDSLLLFVRIAAIALLALALSEPFVKVHGAVDREEPSCLAIVLDDSMSMSRRPDGDGPSAIERGVEESLERLRALPPGSEAALILAGRDARLIVPRTDDLERVRAGLEGLGSSSGRGTDLAGALSLAERQLDSSRHPKRLLVTSDFAAHATGQPLRWPSSSIDVELVALEGLPTANRAIVEAIAFPDPTSPGRASIRAEVRVQHDPDAEGSGITLVLEHAGAEIDRAEATLRGGVARFSLRGPWVEEGDASAQLRLLGEDALAMDDRRGLILSQRAAIRALLVNGEPHASRTRDELGFLIRAIEAASPALGGVQYRQIDRASLSSEGFAPYDLVVLANVRAPPAAVTRRLEAFVRGGGGLLVTSGRQIIPRRLARALGELLAARPVASVEPDAPRGLILDPEAALLEGGLEGLSRARTRRYLAVDPPSTGAEIPLRFEDGSPALVLAERGRGRIALLSTSLDDAWTDLPYRPGFVPLIARLFAHLAAAPQTVEDIIDPGAAVALRPPPGTESLTVIGPDGSRHSLHEGADFEATDLPGAYRVIDEAEQDMSRLAFVLAPPPEESDLSAGPIPELAITSRPAERHESRREPIDVWLFLLAGG